MKTAFEILDTENKATLTKGKIFESFAEKGFDADNPRIQNIFGFMDRRSKIKTDDPKKQKINPEAIKTDEFAYIVKGHEEFVTKITQDDLIIPNFNKFTDDLENIYKKTAKNKKGDVARYIPQLARVKPEQFALSLCTIDGQTGNFGDYEESFCIQSTCKPINYALALELHGAEKVHTHVGREPSGQKFNEITLNRASLPHNPMINAGAIMCSALINPDQSLADRFDHIKNTWQNLAGGAKVGYDNSVYHSEKETADRNFALAHFMREVGAFPENTDIQTALDLYFQCCSIEMTTQHMSVVASVLANGGICPTTDKAILSSETVKNTLSLMYSCGMYDFSGEFAFTVGLPAKSGVSGVVMLVVPNTMGIAIWSPRIDELGNSTRGLEFCENLIAKYKLHTYDSLIRSDDKKIDPRLK